MDEPTVGVDPQSRNRIFEMIEKLRGEGMSIIYTTHYMEEAERLCDRIAIVDHGKHHRPGQPAKSWCRTHSATRSEVLARFRGPPDRAAGWVARARRAATSTARRSSRSSIPPKSRACWRTPPRPGSNWLDVSLRQAEPRIGVPAIDGKGVARLMLAIIRTAMVSLRRDRAALALSFILPVVFFSIFAVIFGGRRDSTPKVTVHRGG